MKKVQGKFIVLIAIACLSIASAAFAQATTKIAIIDAGSSGSRLFVYEVTKNDNDWHIKEVEQTKDPIMNTGRKPGLCEDGKLKNGISEINSLIRMAWTDFSTRSVYVLATAGMRMCSGSIEEIDGIYNDFGALAATISGAYEGYYAWLATCALGIGGGTLDVEKCKSKKLGIIEIGGASLQQAYFYERGNCLGTLISGLHGVNICSKSYLGWGVRNVSPPIQGSVDFTSSFKYASPSPKQSLQNFDYITWYNLGGGFDDKNYDNSSFRKWLFSGKERLGNGIKENYSWTAGAALDIVARLKNNLPSDTNDSFYFDYRSSSTKSN